MPVKHRLGALDLAIVSDGSFYQDAGAVFGVVPRIMWERFAGRLDERHRMSLALNSVLLRSQGKLVLIETGVGDKPEGGRRQASPMSEGTLLGDLATLGVRPEEIDVVINTHLHFDHCGWNTRFVDGDLALTFPNAEYLIMKGEWEDATHPNERTRATYLAENIDPLRDSGHLKLIDGEYPITDEITILPTPATRRAMLRSSSLRVGKRRSTWVIWPRPWSSSSARPGFRPSTCCRWSRWRRRRRSSSARSTSGRS